MIGSHKGPELSLFSNLGIDGGGEGSGSGSHSADGGVPAAESDSASLRMYRNLLPLQISRPETKKNTITAEEISKYFHIPLNHAARQLGICPTYLKKLCRRNNIPSWPYRKLKSMEKRNMSEDDQAFADPSDQSATDSNESTRHPKNDSLRSKQDSHSPQQISHSSKSTTPFQINGMVAQPLSSPHSSDGAAHKSKSARQDSSTPVLSSFALAAHNGNSSSSSSSRIEQQRSTPVSLSQTSLAIPQICSQLQISQMPSSSLVSQSVPSQAQLNAISLHRNLISGNCPNVPLKSAVIAAAAAASNSTLPQSHGVVIPTPHPYSRKQPQHPFHDFNPLLPVRPPTSASYLPPIRLVAPQVRSLSSAHSSPERSPFLTPNLSSASSPTSPLALESPHNPRKRSYDEFMENFDLNPEQYDIDRSSEHSSSSSASWTPSSQSAFCRTKRRCASADSFQHYSSSQQRSSSLPSVNEILCIGSAQTASVPHTNAARSNPRHTPTACQDYDDDFAVAQSRLRVDCAPSSNSGGQVCVMTANSGTSLRPPLALADPHLFDTPLIRTPGPGTPVTPNALNSCTTVSPPPATPPENTTSPSSHGQRPSTSRSNNNEWMHNPKLISGLMAGLENAAAGVVITVNTPEDSRSIGKLLCFNSVVAKLLPTIFTPANVGEEISRLLEGDIVSQMLETVRHRSTSVMLKSRLMSADVVVFVQRLDRLESQPNQQDQISTTTTTTTTNPAPSIHSGYMWFFTLASSAHPPS